MDYDSLKATLRPLESTSIKAAGFSEGILTIAFSGKTLYRYSGVPLLVYRDLMASKSPGQFFQQHIRTKFGAPEKVEPEAEIHKAAPGATA